MQGVRAHEGAPCPKFPTLCARSPKTKPKLRRHAAAICWKHPAQFQGLAWISVHEIGCEHDHAAAEPVHASPAVVNPTAVSKPSFMRFA